MVLHYFVVFDVVLYILVVRWNLYVKISKRKKLQLEVEHHQTSKVKAKKVNDFTWYYVAQFHHFSFDFKIPFIKSSEKVAN